MKDLTNWLSHKRAQKASQWLRGRRVLDFGAGRMNLLGYLPDWAGYYPHEKGQAVPVLRFDTLFLLAVLEHLAVPVWELRGVDARRIVVTTPTPLAYPMLKIGAFLGLWNRDVDDHRKHFTKGELVKLLRALGYSVTHYEKWQWGMNQLIVGDRQHMGCG